MSEANPISISESDSDTEQEDDPNLPSREECESRCQAFVEITGTDSALAMFYLQDREWDVNRAISDYYAAQENNSNSQSSAPNGSASGTVTAAASSDLENLLRSIRQATTPSLTLQPPVVQPKNEKHIKVLSWNIDGLDPDNLQSRTEGMCSVLLQEAPEIIFLQEVVDRSLKIIQSKCASYQVFPSVGGQKLTPGAYFTAMLLRKDCVSVESVNVADFPTTLMTRNLLEIKCEVKKTALTLMTSHLESMSEHSSERKKQLKICFDRMMTISKDETVIFGGDLNLRDKELTGQSAVPLGVLDMWEFSGKRSGAQYTWDLTKNDNKQYGMQFQPRCRFDRLYIRHADRVKLKPVYFELVGIQRLASCRRFPSDHWGILSHLDILA